MSENEVTAKLQGRVAQILNAREVAINIGATHGVKKGMKFAILADKPLEIVDPETNQVLDVIDREKVRVEASEVRDCIAICKTFRTKTTGGGLLASTMWEAARMQQMFEPSRTVVETLRVEDSQFPPPLEPEESYVKVNDRVVLIESPPPQAKEVGSV